MSRSEDALEIAKKVFSDIQKRFPLHSTIDEGDHVEFSVTFPVQPGLKHKVNLHLQNADELHLCVSHFQLGWFPCTKSEVAADYIRAVSGFLSGDYRVVEHYRGDKCVKAVLESPQKSGWKVEGTWALLWLPLPWQKKSEIAVRNA